MGKSVLEGKTILAVDDEPDLLELLKEEILDACPSCRVETATSFEQATEMLEANPYDLVILDIMGVRGFEILDLAVKKRLPVVMLTAHALTPEALNLSLEKGARAYLSKEKLMEIVPYLEDALTYEHLPGWKRLFKKMDHFFSSRWGEHWKGNEKEFWKELEEKSRRIRW